MKNFIFLFLLVFLCGCAPYSSSGYGYDSSGYYEGYYYPNYYYEDSWNGLGSINSVNDDLAFQSYDNYKRNYKAFRNSLNPTQRGELDAYEANMVHRYRVWKSNLSPIQRARWDNYINTQKFKYRMYEDFK